VRAHRGRHSHVLVHGFCCLGLGLYSLCDVSSRHIVGLSEGLDGSAAKVGLEHRLD